MTETDYLLSGKQDTKHMTFIELSKIILEEEKRPLSVEEIWALAQAKGYDKQVGSKGKTPPATIGAQIYVNMRDQKDSPFIKMDTRPQKFYLKTLPLDGLERGALDEVLPKVQLTKKFDYLERDLHPLLAYYVHLYLKAHTKTILHAKSEKKEFGEWIHPDMVGCYFPIDEWKPEVFEFSSLVGNVSIKLFSFEIKRDLSFSNLRESFFQTVSNSSWANEAYLVASRISNDDEFLSELRRLSASFGIGVIKLDIEDPDSSEILFPARYKEYLDWDMINKLTTMNPDFKGFLRRIRMDISNKEVTKERYDKILSKDQLIQMIATASSASARVAGLNKGAIRMNEEFDEPLKFSVDS